VPFVDLETLGLTEFIDQNIGDDRTLWVFQHIPKTAGSSFSREMSRYRRPYCNIHINYEDRLLKFHDAIGQATSRFLAEDEAQPYLSASGHLPLRLIRHIRENRPRARTVTFLREPQARLISAYRYQRTPVHPVYKEFIERYPTIESFVEDQTQSNAMCRFMFGDDASDMNADDIRTNAGRSHDFIGLLEMYPMSFNTIFKLMGVDGKFPKEHARKTVSNDVNEVSVNNTLSEMIRQTNQQDYVLYEYVRKVLLPHDEAFWSNLKDV
jgi:Sulfotransferase family